MTKTKDVQISTRLLAEGAQEHKFKMEVDATLLGVLQEGVERAGEALLANEDEPLDLLRNLGKHDQPGEPIADLAQSLGEYLEDKDATKAFGIELVLAFQVNSRWAVATGPQMTPREILALPAINLEFQSYTLYARDSIDLLPLDMPVTITRGLRFDAQADGKYGSRV